MTKEEAQNMSQEKIFLHMEARLAAALEETKKKYGEECAVFVHNMITDMMVDLAMRNAHGLLPCSIQIIFCAWIETMAAWNAKIDDLVRK